MSILDTLTINQAFLYQGKDFDSSSVLKMLAGSTDDGKHYIGVCWERDDFYLYDVNQFDVIDFEHTVKSASSVGRYAIILKKSSNHPLFAVITQEDIDNMLNKKSKANKESYSSLEALFTNWLTGENSNQALPI